MAQYREGTITLGFGALSATGTGTRWLSNVKTGDMLLVDATGPAAFVASVLSDTELLLEQAWSGGDAIASPYAIHRDFDPTTGAPLLAQGDTALPLVFNRAIGRLSAQTGVAVASNAAAVLAQTARDEAQAAATATATDAAATAADREAVFLDKSAVITSASEVEADRQTVLTARDVATAGAASTTADRAAVAADKAATATALSQAQALVGSAGTGTASGLVYAAAAKNLVTAADVVAVHVYDTSSDSDGGAWTERCQATSWYREALNTSKRGATRRFPRVALIVARPYSITIYDAHDLDSNGVPRMWMVFDTLDAIIAMFGTAVIRCLTARNGMLCVGLADNGLHLLDFPTDRCDRIVAGGRLRRRANIAGRNSVAGERIIQGADGILSNAISDVHARVLPGAPLNSADLPVPTIAVATATGVSVIHPWGAVYDITSAAFGGVQISADGRVAIQYMYGTSSQFDVGPLPYADIERGAWRREIYSRGSVPSLMGASGNNLRSTKRQAAGWVAACDDRLSMIAEDTGNQGNGMVAYAATGYATGWLPGDIRGGWLCDIVAGNISASGELVANGDFASGAAGWNPVSCTLSGVSGALRVSTTNPFGTASQGLATVAGQTYLLSVAVVAVSGGTPFACVGTAAGGSDIVGVTALTPGTSGLLQFTAVGTTTHVCFGNYAAGMTTDVDNVSVRQALPNRSRKGAGLLVNGTVSRTALPCGLTAASGFDASNYLEQPFNPELQFGTGDLSISWWASSNAGTGYYLDLDSPATGARLSLVALGAKLHFAVHDGSVGASVTSISDFANTGLHHWVLNRRGNSLELWCDGTLEAAASAAAVGSLSNMAALLRVGQRVSASAPATGLQCLMLRISGTAPTPAQIRRMYQDERVLVIDGQPATLGGTSNNVKALFVNEEAGTVLAGTDDGISVFAGLARTAYLDGTSAGAAIGNDTILALSGAGPFLLAGTTANAGLVCDALIARDRLSSARIAPREAPDIVQARCVTTDATPTDMVPRVRLGERETLVVEATIQARQYGATAGQGGAYKRLARYVRDAGGTVTLAGSVQTIGTDQETTAGMDATLVIDTAAQTITPRVTGVAGTRMVWTARIAITRISEEAAYAVA